jgi:WD40 repeat protein
LNTFFAGPQGAPVEFKWRKVVGLLVLFLGLLLTLLLALGIANIIRKHGSSAVPWWLWFCPAITGCAVPISRRIRSGRPWQFRFSLATLLLAVVFAGGCFGLWFRGTPWGCEANLPGREAAFSKDGHWIVTWGLDSVHLCDAQSGQVRLTLRDNTPCAMHAAFSPDSRLLVTTYLDGNARLWEVETGKELTVLGGHGGLCGFGVFSPDGQRLAILVNKPVGNGGTGTVHVWDVPSMKRLFALKEQPDVIGFVLFSPDGRRMFTTSPQDGVSFAWDAATGEQLKDVPGSRPAFSPNGQQMVVARADTAVVIDARTFEPLLSLTGHANLVWESAYSADGRRIVTASFDGSSRVWDTWTGACLAVLEQTSPAISASFSPDGRLVVTSENEGTVRLWDAVTFQKLAALESNDGFSREGCFAPDGNRVITSGLEPSHLWSQRRPAYAWGVLAVPEFWIAVCSGGVLLIVAVRKLLLRRS